MELLQLPSFGGSSQPAETFYLRKMSVTPAGVFDEVEQTGVTYLFSQLHGKTNSNHITSILDDAIDKKKKTGTNNRKLRVNWDNCSVNKCYLLARYGIELIRLGLYDSVEPRVTLNLSDGGSFHFPSTRSHEANQGITRRKN